MTSSTNFMLEAMKYLASEVKTSTVDVDVDVDADAEAPSIHPEKKTTSQKQPPVLSMADVLTNCLNPRKKSDATPQ